MSLPGGQTDHIKARILGSSNNKAQDKAGFQKPCLLASLLLFMRSFGTTLIIRIRIDFVKAHVLPNRKYQKFQQGLSFSARCFCYSWAEFCRDACFLRKPALATLIQPPAVQPNIAVELGLRTGGSFTPRVMPGGQTKGTSSGNELVTN